MKTEKNEACRNVLLQVQDLDAQELARINKETTNGSYASDPGTNDCRVGIEISSMRSIGGSNEENFEVALMVAEDDNQSSADGSAGMEPDPSSAAFHDPQLEQMSCMQHLMTWKVSKLMCPACWFREYNSRS